ncbi:hypothetical protein AB0F11_30320 [Streptomyces sp. NPDC032472]
MSEEGQRDALLDAVPQDARKPAAILDVLLEELVAAFPCPLART